MNPEQYKAVDDELYRALHSESAPIKPDIRYHEWIKCSEQKPPLGRVLAMVDGGMAVLTVWDSDAAYLGMTHWMPLPPPPPRQSSFEAWWDRQQGMPYGDHVKWFFNSELSNGTAKVIWDAAIAASKSPDFVP